MTQARSSNFFTQAMAKATHNTATTSMQDLLAFMCSRLGQQRAQALVQKVGPMLTVEQQFTLRETHLYGSSRLGVKNQSISLSSRVASVQNGSLTPVSSTLLNTDSVFAGTTTALGLPKAPAARVFYRTWGSKQYELSNWLGNVQVTVSDKKIGVLSSNGLDFTAYQADVTSATDYYAYGMEMPGRSWKPEEYRFGFNGKEIEKESFFQDYGLRIYYSKLSRFMSVDPLSYKYPWNGTYSFAELTPIWGVDLDGGELQISNGKIYKGPVDLKVLNNNSNAQISNFTQFQLNGFASILNKNVYNPTSNSNNTTQVEYRQADPVRVDKNQQNGNKVYFTGVLTYSESGASAGIKINNVNLQLTDLEKTRDLIGIRDNKIVLNSQEKTTKFGVGLGFIGWEVSKNEQNGQVENKTVIGPFVFNQDNELKETLLGGDRFNIQVTLPLIGLGAEVQIVTKK